MANREVLSSINEWMQPMYDEYRGLRMAVDPLDRQVLEGWKREGRFFEMMPAKFVFTINSWTKVDKYSGGIDAVTLRALLRYAGHMAMISERSISNKLSCRHRCCPAECRSWFAFLPSSVS